ncbi:class I tRNA ligase family protein [Candidatus Saccharibacteria bacterium]|nr:class I tRNA ligase family protein [Candidatus Saccharibacteria bacterium]
MKRYNPSEIEPKWQKTWADTQSYDAPDFDKKPKFVMLTEFPYPSGAGLHLGHAREYTLGDVLARWRRAQGYNVLYPMGFDAFGLPTENYAIKNKIAPQVATEQNVNTFTQQFKSLGYSFDWSRSFSTTDPDYYKWTQWLFLKFYEAGLAYQDEIDINWCPRCKTGLANEEVEGGCHERCGEPVEKKPMKQWMLKITAYADRLIDGLKTVDYPSRIADQQINWIGKKTGINITYHTTNTAKKQEITVFTTRPDTNFGATFIVLAPEHPLVDQILSQKIKLKDGDIAVEAIKAYVQSSLAKTDIERQGDGRKKTGVFTGLKAKNPLNNIDMPVWISDFVLGGFGTGALVAVPGHDQRDYEFATEFDLPIIQVVAVEEKNIDTPPKKGKKNTKRKTVSCLIQHPTEDKFLTVLYPKRGWQVLPKGGIEDGETTEEAARREIREETGYKNLKLIGTLPLVFRSRFYAAHKDVNRDITTEYLHFQLTDLDQDPLELDEIEQAEAIEHTWIPRSEITSLTHHDPLQTLSDWLDGRVTVNESEGIMINSGFLDGLDVHDATEKIMDYMEEKAMGQRVTHYRLRDWIFSRQHYWGEPIPIIHCDKCGVVPVPAADLPVELPVVESYEVSDDGKSPLSKITDWVNVKCPKCAKPAKRETDTMPNWAGSSWYYLRYFDPHNDTEFAAKDKLDYWSGVKKSPTSQKSPTGAVDLYLGGMEHTTLHLLYSRFWHQFFYDQGLVPTPEPYAARRGQGIILAEDGRKMSKSLGNVVNPTEIIDAGYGADSLRVALAFIAPYDQTTPWNPEGVTGAYRFLNRIWTLAQSDLVDDTPEIQRNIHKTIKKLTEDLEKMQFNTAVAALMECVNGLYKTGPSKDALNILIRLLAPFAPHLAAELWLQLGNSSFLEHAGWPEYDEKYLVSDTITIVVQVNGKLRAELQVDTKKASDEALLKSIAQSEPKVKTFIGSTPVKKVIVVPGKLVNIVI